jgi:hypothetical protein
MTNEQPTKASLAASGLLIFVRNLLLSTSAVFTLAAIGWGAGKAAELVGVFPYRSAPASYFKYTEDDCVAYGEWLASRPYKTPFIDDRKEGQYYFTDPCEMVVRGAPETLWQSLGFGLFVTVVLMVAIAMIVAFYEYLVGLGRTEIGRKKLRVCPWRGLYDPERLPPRHVETGETYHPDLPSWPDDEQQSILPLLHAQGFDVQFVQGDFLEGVFEDAEAYRKEMRTWQPRPPAGDGWRLVAVGDTEDGPYATFIRPLSLADGQAGVK